MTRPKTPDGRERPFVTILLAALLLLLRISGDATAQENRTDQPQPPAVIGALSGVATPADLETAMDADLNTVAKKFAATEPKSLTGSEHKKWLRDYQRAMDQVRRTYAARDGRFSTIEKAIKNIGGEGDFLNSGSAPKTPKSDVDITELKPGSAKKLIGELNAKGYSIKPHPTIPGRFDDPAKKLVVWETPPNVEVGTQEWKDWVTSRAGAEDTFATSGGLHKTSGGKLGAADPQGAVLDNVKKAVEAGIHRNPATDPIDAKTIGKSVSKSLEWTNSGRSGLTTKEFSNQANELRKGRSWDEAGITSPNDPPETRSKKIGDWLAKAQDTLSKTYNRAVRQSRSLNEARVKELHEIIRKPAGADGALTPRQQKRVAKLIDEIRSIPQGNTETLKTISERSPEMAGKLRGQKVRTNPDGTVTNLKTGKTTTRSEFAEGATASTRKGGARTVKESVPPAQQPKEGGPAKPATPSKITKYGGGFLLIYQGYEAVKAYSDYLDKAARTDPENFGVLTIGKGLGLGVATFFGIPGLIELGERSGREVREQYEKDMREGKTWLLPPTFWGGAYGAWNFGRAIFVDPLIAGGEAVVEGWRLWDDYAKARKAAEDALNVETRLKEKYKPLEDMMSHVIGGPLPPIWDKNRLKYYKIFKPLLDNPAELERIMKTPRGRDLWKWIKEYKDRRAKELGITFGRPGADNPDDNDNIGRALMALPPQERPLWLRAAEKGDAFTQDFLASRDRGTIDDLDPETLGVFLQASRITGRTGGAEATPPMMPEQWDAVREIFSDLLRHVGEAPDTAVLAGGYARGVAVLLGAAGEPATLVQPTDTAETLSRFRLLIIPTGALSDWSMSAPFRRTMETYVAGGGTILAFAQQLGKEFAVLPSGKGTPVTGYGFAEDQSCQYASSKIAAPVGAFSSMTKTTPDFNVDGYFLDYPPESTVWLSRTKNDQPCMISYPHGKGRVVLSTLYMDWAAGNHQGTTDEQIFFRDLVAFLLAPEETPLFTKADTVSLRLGLPNPPANAHSGTTFRPFVLRPDGSVMEAKDVVVASPTSAVLSLPKLDMPGYYRVGGVLLDEGENPVSQVPPAIRFGVSALPTLAAQNRQDGEGVRMSLQSDLEQYIRGAVGHFTILAWNNGDTPRKIRANWRFPHNLWGASGKDKGDYQGSTLMELAPHSRASAELKIRIVNADGIDRLWVDFVDEETKKTIVTLSKGFYTKTPQTPVSVTAGKNAYSVGERLSAEARFGNPFGAKSTGTVQFVLSDAAGRTAATTDVPFEAEKDGAVVSCDIPLGDLFSGQCILQAFVTLRGAMTGIGELPFTYRGPALPFRSTVIDRFTGTPVGNAHVSFYLGTERTEAVSDADGKLSLSLPAAVYTVAAEAEGYNAFTRSMAISPASDDAVAFRLLPFGKGAGTGMVHGTLFDRVTNEIVPDMAIQFIQGTNVLEIRSDARGIYSLALEPGDYTVRCVQDGAGLGDFPLRVLEGWNQTLDLYPACGKTQIRLIDQVTGKPLSGASVAFRLRTNAEAWTADATTHVNRGTIFRTSPGRRQIRVRLDGYHPLDTETWVSERPSVCTLALRPVKSALVVRVSDLVTGAPIEGADVAAMRPGQPPQAGGDASGRTGKDGSCTVRLEDGRWVVAAEANGYQKLSTETVTAVNLPAVSEPPVLQLYMAVDTAKAPGTLKVRIRDILTGNPVSGVSIQSTSTSGGNTTSAETDASGNATLRVPDGRTALLFKKDRYEELATEIVASYRSGDVEEFYMVPVHTIWPVVVRDQRTAKAIGEVRVFRIEGETRRDMGLSGSDGVIRLNVPRGRQILEFVKDGYAALRTEFFFSGTGREETLTDEVYLSQISLPYSGVVRDATGHPVSNVTVAVRQGESMKTMTTASDGRFATDLAAGVFELSFSADGYPAFTTQGYLGGASDADEEYVLTSGDVSQGTISFRVVDALTGKPIPKFSCYLLGAAWQDGRDGAISATAPAGNRQTIIRAEGYYETGSFYPTTFPGKTVVRTIRMRPATGELSLRVLDALTGKAIPKFTCFLLNTAWRDCNDGTVTTRVPAGNRQTIVRAQGYHETGSFYPTAFTGRSVTQTVFLWPVTGEMTFRVLDAITDAPLPVFSIYFMNSGWREGKDGVCAGTAEPGNRQTIIRAQGYLETGSFYPSTHHGRSVTRTIRLWPESGGTTFRVRDALTGEAISRFSAYLMSTNWQEGRDGEIRASVPPGNRQTIVRAEGYYETGSFYPTTFRGRDTGHTIFLWPSTGTMTFHARDALTGEPIAGPFSAYIQNNNWQRSEPAGSATPERTLSARAEPGNRQSILRADGYFETGSFYPTVIQGRDTELAMYLHPEAPQGLLSLRVEDIVTGMPIRNVTIVPSGERPISAPDGTATHAAKTHIRHQWFQASAPGYRTVSLPGYFVTGRQGVSLVLPMEEELPAGAGSLRVSVTDTSGAPLVDARVTLGGGGKERVASTDITGRAFFADIRSGIYTLSAQKSGHLGESAKSAVPGGTESLQALRLSPLGLVAARRPYSPRILSVPDAAVLRPGERQTLQVTVENEGDAAGRSVCVFDILGLLRNEQEVFLGARERKQISFEAVTPEDAVSSLLACSVTLENQTATGSLRIEAPSFRCVASTDREAYREGDTLSLRVHVSTDAKSGVFDDLQVRATFNETSLVRDLKVVSGEAVATFRDIPVAFRGNKLMFGLYHKTGRSVLIDAIPVPDAGRDVLLLPDKPRYSAGETIRLRVSGTPKGAVSLVSDLFPGSDREITLDDSGNGSVAIPLPTSMPTGTHTIRCGNATADIDIRGYETKILDRRIEPDAETGSLRLLWTAATLGRIPCRWSVTATSEGGTVEEEEIASGTLTLEGERADYDVTTDLEAGESRELTLTLLTEDAGENGDPVALIRYVWNVPVETEDGDALPETGAAEATEPPESKRKPGEIEAPAVSKDTVATPDAGTSEDVPARRTIAAAALQKHLAAQLRNEGAELQRSGRYSDALARYRESLTVLPDRELEEYAVKFETLLRKRAKRLADEGTALQRQKKYAEAIAKFRQSLEYYHTPKVEAHIRKLRDYMDALERRGK